MASTSFLFAVLLLSWACMALGQDSGAGTSLPCVQKLLPCQQYLHATAPPPMTCCEPLKEALNTETQCLCAVFNNEALMKSFNVTKDEALQMAKACGAKADLSLCNKTSSNETSSAAPTSTPAATKGSTPSTSKSGAVSKKISWSSGTVLAATWVSLLTLAFSFRH